MQRNLAPLAIGGPSSFNPVMLVEIGCCHVHNVLIQTIALAAHSCASFVVLHYSFYFALQQLDIFVQTCLMRHSWVITKVVELAHGVHVDHANLMGGLCSPCVPHSSQIGVKLSAKLPSKAHRLRARRESLIIQEGQDSLLT